MRKYILIGCILVIVGLLVPLGVVFASYDYYIPISIYNNGTGTLTSIPILITLNNSQLADMGYIQSSGLDTEVQEGASSRYYCVIDERLGVFISSIEGYQSRTYNYRLGVDPPQTVFPFIVGDGGYVTISDHADLEIGDNFSVEIDGWIDEPIELAPEVVATATSTEDAKVASHDVTLPGGIEVGDLLIVDFGAIGWTVGTCSITWPGDWTDLGKQGNTEVAAGIAYRVATGSEGSTITVTTSQSAYSAHQTFRIINYQGTPEGAITTSQTQSTTPNPPNLTPSWGDGNVTLWIVGFGGGDATSRTVSSYPTNYSNGTLTKSTAGYAHTSSARRELKAASEDPGVYTMSGNVWWYAWTLGIEGIEFSIFKKDAFSIYRDGDDIIANILGGTPKVVTASGFPPTSAYLVEVWANTTHLAIDVDGSTEDSVALGGASVPDNVNDWLITMPNWGSYGHYVDGILEAWYQLNTMVLGTNLVDRSGNGQTGTITWGSNPSSIEITIGGLDPYTSYVAAEEEEDEVPSVLPTPGVISPDETIGATGEGLPLQARFQAAADSLDWSLPTTYSVMFVIVAIVVGVAGLAIGSTWGFVIGFGATSAFFGAVRDSSGYLVTPLWITIVCVMFAVFLGYVWRYS